MEESEENCSDGGWGDAYGSEEEDLNEKIKKRVEDERVVAENMKLIDEMNK